MHLHTQRSWITPLMIGAFGLSAVTGVLMFFHLESGLNKLAHEWLSWLLLAAAVLHVTLHLPQFKRYFAQSTARAVMLLFALLLAGSFVIRPPAGDGPAFAGPVRALAEAPLPVLAQVARLSPEDLNTRLTALGYPSDDAQASLRERVGPELRTQLGVLRKLLPARHDGT